MRVGSPSMTMMFGTSSGKNGGGMSGNAPVTDDRKGAE